MFKEIALNKAVKASTKKLSPNEALIKEGKAKIYQRELPKVFAEFDRLNPTAKQPLSPEAKEIAKFKQYYTTIGDTKRLQALDSTNLIEKHEAMSVARAKLAPKKSEIFLQKHPELKKFLEKAKEADAISAELRKEYFPNIPKLSANDALLATGAEIVKKASDDNY